MSKLLEMRLRFKSLRHIEYPPYEMAFAIQNHCLKKDTEGYYAALRLTKIIFSDSKKLVLRLCQLDLLKPRMSVTLLSSYKIDSRLAQI